MNFIQVRYRHDDPGHFGLGEMILDGPPQSQAAHIRLLANGIKITSALFPELARELDGLQEAMELEHPVDCFAISDPHMQAYCCPREENGVQKLSVILTSGLIERLTAIELRFVIGHEVGHFLCEHWRYPQSENDETNSGFGLKLALLQLQRAAEISADRLGLLACGSLEAACAAMIKVAAGLGHPHLRPDIPSLLVQFRELTSRAGDSSTIWATHPIIPLRIRALLRFDAVGRAMLRQEAEGPAKLCAVDDAIVQDFEKASGFALQRLADKHLEEARMWALVFLFVADGVLSKLEQKMLREILGEIRAEKVIGLVKTVAHKLHNQEVCTCLISVM